MTARRVTAGGTFDRSVCPIYFAAGKSDGMNFPVHMLQAVNDLKGAGGEAMLVAFLDAGHRVLLDSGIFNLTNEHMRATGCDAGGVRLTVTAGSLLVDDPTIGRVVLKTGDTLLIPTEIRIR